MLHLARGAGENDPVARVVAQMTRFNDGLDAINDGISAAGQSYSRPPTLADPTIQQLRQLIEGLRAVPVQVDIKVVPVQDEKGSIEKMDAPDSPALEFKPEVNQGQSAPKAVGLDALGQAERYSAARSLRVITESNRSRFPPPLKPCLSRTTG